MRLAARAVLLVLLLVGGVGLAGVAGAQGQESFAHRYVIYGRVVDADSQAVEDLLVDAGLPAALGAPQDCPRDVAGTTLEALGSTRTQRRTGPKGDFVFCFQVGALPDDPGRGVVRIESVNFSTDFALDPIARVTFLNLQLTQPLPAQRTDELNSSHRVIARLWYPVPNGTLLEDVPVRAMTLAGKPVTFTLDLGTGRLIQGQTLTNAHGDFASDIPLTGRPTVGTITLAAEGRSMTLPLEPYTAMTAFSFELPPPAPPLPAAVTIAIALAVVALIAAAAWYVARRAAKP